MMQMMSTNSKAIHFDLSQKAEKGSADPTYKTYTSRTSTAMPNFFPTTKMGRKYGKKIFAREIKKEKSQVPEAATGMKKKQSQFNSCLQTFKTDSFSHCAKLRCSL